MMLTEKMKVIPFEQFKLMIGDIEPDEVSHVDWIEEETGEVIWEVGQALKESSGYDLCEPIQECVYTDRTYTDMMVIFNRTFVVDECKLSKMCDEPFEGFSVYDHDGDWVVPVKIRRKDNDPFDRDDIDMIRCYLHDYDRNQDLHYISDIRRSTYGDVVGSYVVELSYTLL